MGSRNLEKKLIRDSTQFLAKNSSEDENLEGILDELEDEDLQQFEEELLEISRLSAKAGAQQKVPINRDGEYELKLSDDGMTMMLTIHPALGYGIMVSEAVVLADLTSRHVLGLVDREMLSEAIRRQMNGQPSESLPIVQGYMPTPPSPTTARLSYRLLGAECITTVAWDPSQAYEEVMLCEKGDVVFRVSVGERGKPGLTADGQVIEPPPPTLIHMDAGAFVKQKGKVLVAERQGLIVVKDNEISIRPTLIVPGDVEPGERPVEFDGDVIVKGSVRCDASLTATGNITIHGLVEAANVVSTQGHLHLHAGVAGRDRAELQAQTGVDARFIERAIVKTPGRIELVNGALHSTLVAGDSIHVTSVGSGRLAGGCYAAKNEINCATLGTDAGVPTRVTVGVEMADLSKLLEIDRSIMQADQTLDEAGELLDRLQRATGDPEKLPPQLLNEFLRMRKVQVGWRVKRHKLVTLREKVLEALRIVPAAKLVVIRRIADGVTVQLGLQTYQDTARDRGVVMTVQQDQVAESAA